MDWQPMVPILKSWKKNLLTRTEREDMKRRFEARGMESNGNMETKGFLPPLTRLMDIISIVKFSYQFPAGDGGK